MPADNLKTWPEKIYLQVHDYDEELPPYREMRNGVVTWCEDPVVSCEVPYIRADLVPALPTAEEIAVIVKTVLYGASARAKEPLADCIADEVLALLEKWR